MEFFSEARPEHRSRLSDMVEIARADLPRAAPMGVVAMQAGDDDVSRTMLVRLYAEAIDADCEYLAELADGELRELERSGGPSAA